METNKRDTLLGIIAFVVLVALAIGLLRLIWGWLTAIWEGMLGLIETISTLDTVLIIAIVSGAITILGIVVNSIISIVVKVLEHQNKRKSELREKMEKPYAKLVELIYDMMMGAKTSETLSETEIVERTIAFSKEITLHGSNRVVKKWAKYRISAGKCNPIQSMVLLEEILYGIRKDLGIKRGTMRKGDILSLFFNDMDDIIQKNKKIFGR
jgi:hypothetical protein